MQVSDLRPRGTSRCRPDVRGRPGRVAPLVASALALGLLIVSTAAGAMPGLEAVQVVTGPAGEQTYTVTIQLLAIMTALTLLPAALIMMTAFTRIIVVLAILRQALGTAQTPSNQILLGLSLFLTFFVMAPVFDQMYVLAVEPYLREEIGFAQALQLGVEPLRVFMLEQTREPDLVLFAELASREPAALTDTVPLSVLMPAFVTSELKTAFEIGFLIFVPFLVVDLVVASVLMSMGMMMLSPLIISFPFKIMLFVLIDGWTLIVGTLASSFVV